MSETQVANRKETAPVLLPQVDVIEDAGGITVYADLPGVPKDKLTLNVEADTLTIAGEVSLASADAMQALHVEVSQPRYHRAFTLSRELDSEKIAAEFRDGVLKLHIPKAAHAQPKKIAVSVQ